jgi:hypothetical protein
MTNKTNTFINNSIGPAIDKMISSGKILTNPNEAISFWSLEYCVKLYKDYFPSDCIKEYDEFFGDGTYQKHYDWLAEQYIMAQLTK